MKRLNKLLMPIVGLSVIAAVAMPLTSCNNGNRTDISINDWKKAIDFLLCEDEAMPYWYSNDDDVAAEQIIEKGKTVYNTWNNIIYQDGDYYAKTTKYKEDVKTEVYHEYSKMVGVWNYNTYMTEDKKLINSPQWNYYLTGKAVDSLFLALRSLYNSFSEFKLDKETKTFSWSGSIEYDTYSFKSVLTNVKFDSNKKISYFETTFEEYKDETQVRLATMRLHFNYGKKVIDFPKLIDDRLSKRKYTADSTSTASVKSLSASLAEEGTVINFTALAGGENQIFVKDTKEGAPDVQWLVHDVEETDPNKYYPGCTVVKNGKILVYGTDYTITPAPTPTPTPTTGGNTIAFTTPLNKGDVIEMWVKPIRHSTFSYQSTYAFTLGKK